MRKIITYIVSLFIGMGTAAAGTMPLRNVEIRRSGDVVEIRGEVDLSYFDLHRQQVALVTPVLRSADGTKKAELEPVAISGRTRAKVVSRGRKLGSETPVPEGVKIITLKGGKMPEYAFSEIFELRSWMYGAQLFADVRLQGCAGAGFGDQSIPVAEAPFVMLREPSCEVAYVVPPVEEVKQRSESHTAYINFAVNRHELLRDHKNNAAELDEIDRIISEVRNDPNLTLDELTVTGYASPEGNEKSNMALSEKRTKAVVDYIAGRFPVDRSILRADWKGDDWDGLRRLMEASDFAHRAEVISIIDNTADKAQRKAGLKNMGAYRRLLADYYPQLRRTEYTISYVARPFDLEEAKVLITTKPQHMSLNEMYMAANSYGRGEPGFKQAFDVAARLFPADPCAKTNSAAVDIENGAYDAAIARIGELDTPQALNNLGAAYAGKKEYDKALSYFRKAAAQGCVTAGENAAKLEAWIDGNENL